jgi:hypothetical protein
MSKVENPFDQFDQPTRDAIDGLIHLGELSTEVEFCGHTFGLRTLRADEEIAAAKIVDSFRGTLREPQAWAAAQVALALTHVDHAEDFCPAIGPDKVSFARARFQYITSNWYQPTIDFLFGEYAELLEKQVIAIRAVQDLSNRSRPTFSPLPDSLTGQGTSDEPTASETLDLP